MPSNKQISDLTRAILISVLAFNLSDYQHWWGLKLCAWLYLIDSVLQVMIMIGEYYLKKTDDKIDNI